MTDITLEQRARELLAAELDEYGLQSTARIVRDGTKMNPTERAAVAAIEAAMRLSAGSDWVLVPRAKLRNMKWESDRLRHDGHRCDFRVRVEALSQQLGALAAAPRHEPGEGS